MSFVRSTAWLRSPANPWDSVEHGDTDNAQQNRLAYTHTHTHTELCAHILAEVGQNENLASVVHDSNLIIHSHINEYNLISHGKEISVFSTIPYNKYCL